MGNKSSKTNKNKPVIMSNGDLYEGQLVDGRPHGYGRLKSPEKGTYEGQFIRGRKSGDGKMFCTNGEFYNGEW